MCTQQTRLTIEYVPLLNEMLEQKDDWTEIRDAKARKKAQNRLNQRAARRRKDPGKSTHLRSRIDDIRSGDQSWNTTTRSSSTLQLPPRKMVLSLAPPQPSTVYPLPNHSSHPEVVRVRSGFYAVDSPIVFPLSSDHLITLIAHNVYRALLTNMVLLHLPTFANCRMASKSLYGIPALPLPTSIPPLLHPTRAQLTTKHPSWIDVFPIPSVRDALIRNLGLFFEDGLCEDTLPAYTIDNIGAMSADRPLIRPSADEEHTGMMVWGEPWEASSWEFTPWFLRKWGWLFQDCYAETLESTNRWRSMRAEDPLLGSTVDWSQGPARRITAEEVA